MIRGMLGNMIIDMEEQKIHNDVPFLSYFILERKITIPVVQRGGKETPDRKAEARVQGSQGERLQAEVRSRG